MKIVICLLSVLCSLDSVLAAEFVASPIFEGKSLPTPPQQDTPWQEPKSSLPETLVSATKVLFEQGMADPRGCDYREVEVGTGNCWSGDSGVVSTCGWVLPQEDATGQKFAICWNGLVYPAVSIGEPADVNADIIALLDADELGRKEHAEKYPDREFSRWYHIATPENRLVSQKTLHPLKVVLLLRLGKVHLAEKLWSASKTSQIRVSNEDTDRYLTLASYWTWGLFDRAICAHMRGDDLLALLSAEKLVSIWQSVEETASKRGYEHQKIGTEVQEYHLGFLEPIQLLLEDQRRRSKTLRRGKTTETKNEISYLIDRLEDARMRQMSQPGGISPSMDPYVQALIKTGDAAVKPLLECMKNDQRLTRSVSFHRDFFPGRNVIAVQEAAYYALEGILKSSFNMSSPDGRYLSARNPADCERLADRIHKYWLNFGDIPIEQRWYEVLDNPRLSPEQWAQAAKNISKTKRREPVERDDWTVYYHRRPADSASILAGEVLREKTDPSVTELMTRRMKELSDLDSDFSENRQKLEKAQQIALALNKWDSKASASALQHQLTLYITWYQEHEGARFRRVPLDRLASFIAELTTLLGRSGNSKALKKYADWVRQTKPETIASEIDYVFPPLWRFTEDPHIAAAAEWLFNSEDSPWNPIIDPRFRHKVSSYDLKESPLVASSAFRRQVLRELQDKQVVGKVVSKTSNLYELTTPTWSSSGNTTYRDRFALSPGKEQSIRICDLYADYVSELEGTVMFQHYWPEEIRDETITSIELFLRQYGSRYREKMRSYNLAAGKPHLHFEVLKQPATNRDYEAGKAIFCLEGQSKTRTWQLPASPYTEEITATWRLPKDKEHSEERPSVEGISGKARKYLGGHGRVYQAEEVLEDGQWRRYVGFVGKYLVAKVPAEEISFNQWNLSGEFVLRLSPSWIVYHKDHRRVRRLEIADHLQVTLQICNNRGVLQKLPPSFRQKEDSKEPSVIEGLEFELQHRPSSGLRFSSPFSSGSEQPWKDVPLVNEPSIPKSSLQRNLKTGEIIDLFTLDLNDCYDIYEPGDYRFGIKFAPPIDGLGVTGVRSIRFSLLERDLSDQPASQ